MRTSSASYYRERMVETIRYQGLWTALSRLIKLAVSPWGVLRMVSFCRMDLTTPLAEVKAKVPIEIDEATPADIEQLTELFEMSYEYRQCSRQEIQTLIRSRWRRGSKCFVARIGNRIVHYNWAYFNREAATGWRIELGEREALCNDALTVEEWRGKGIHAAINNYMLRFLKESGFETAYTEVLSDNISSQKALHRVGWHFFGVFLFFYRYNSDKVRGWVIRGPLAPFVPEEEVNPASYGRLFEK